VKITAVTPVAAAANPSHPDHARWVKEQTLAIEAQHANKLGLSIRTAEVENSRQLERLANRKRKPAAPKKPKRIDTPEQLAKQGVTQRVAKPLKRAPLPACKLCGLCLWCKRSRRISEILRHARELDMRAVGLANEVTAITAAALARNDYKDALGRELPFSRITGHDVDKAVTMGIEWVCDRSVSFMGQWR
jgi:hypothetical protein